MDDVEMDLRNMGVKEEEEAEAEEGN